MATSAARQRHANSPPATVDVFAKNQDFCVFRIIVVAPHFRIGALEDPRLFASLDLSRLLALVIAARIAGLGNRR
jgi:hypothetical protein